MTPSQKHATLIAILLLFSAVLLAPASEAWAGTITYNIIPYYHSDYNHPLDMDRLTGTITVSSSSCVIGTWGSSSPPPPADMTMAVSLTLSNLTEPLTYPPVHEEQTFLVSNMIAWGWLQRDGVTIAADGIYLHERKTTSPVDLGGYLNLNPSGTSPGSAMLCTWSPWDWDGSVSISSRYDLFHSAHQIIDHNANATYGPGPWKIAAVVPEPTALALLVSAVMGLGVVCPRRRK